MKVNAWKNLDVEFEADVSLDDCINEMLDIADSYDGRFRKLSAVDGATKILERVRPQDIGERLTPDALALVRSRLSLWIDAIVDSKPADAVDTGEHEQKAGQ